MNRSKLFGVAFGVLMMAIGAGRAVAGDNDGQADLDKATEKKLAAKSDADLGKVISLCERAIKAGLTPTNAEFANQLYNSALEQRGQSYTGKFFYGQKVLDLARAGGQQLQGLSAESVLKQRESALADLDKLVSRDPKAGSAWLMIARLRARAVKSDDHAAALKAADRAIELLKEEANLQAAALVVRAHLQSGPAKQLADFSEAIKLIPTDAEALWGRAVVLIGEQKFEAALADLNTLADHIDKNVGSDEAAGGDENLAEQIHKQEALLAAVRIYETRGAVLFQLKRNDDAMHSFDRSIALQPKSAEPYVRRAGVRASNKELKGALEDFTAALNIETQNGRDGSGVLLARALVYQRAGDLKNAKADVDAALKNQSGIELIRGLELRATISAQAGEYDQAIDDLEELVKIAPKNPELLAQIGQLYAANKKPDKALEKYDAALALDDKNWRIFVLRGAFLLDAKKYDGAVRDFESALKLRPDDLELLYQVAVTYSSAKLWGRAIEKCNAGLAAKGNTKLELFLRCRADAYLHLGKHAESIRDYEAGLKLEPDDSGIMNNLAWVLATSPDAKLRDAKRAIELGTKACDKTNYQAAFILSTLAAAYAEAGDFDNAQKWAAKAVENGDDEMRPELKKELESYQEKKPWREFLNEGEAPQPNAADAKKPDDAKNASAAKPGDKPRQK